MAQRETTPEEQAAISLLEASGYTVVRQKSYNALRERARVAEALRDMYEQQVNSAHEWGRKEGAEQRRLSDRLAAVAAAAAAQGVSITAINEALGAAPPPSTYATGGVLPPPCPNHHEVQHRGGKPPYCPDCGWRHAKPAQAAQKVAEPKDRRPHSRACGLICRGHGVNCASDCPTCHGRDE